jgi:hypothetical protein
MNSIDADAEDASPDMDELIFLTEFSRFMNDRAPRLLQVLLKLILFKSFNLLDSHFAQVLSNDSNKHSTPIVDFLTFCIICFYVTFKEFADSKKISDTKRKISMAELQFQMRNFGLKTGHSVQVQQEEQFYNFENKVLSGRP